MQSSPCRLCPLKDEDKNNKTCQNCAKRRQYVISLGRSLGDPSATAEVNFPSNASVRPEATAY